MKVSQTERHDNFMRCIRKLKKKIRSIEEDLKVFLSTAVPACDKNYSQGIVRVADLGFEEPPIYKAKHFASRSRKGKGKKTGIRVVFAYFPVEEKVVLLEIYLKSQRSMHDVKFLKNYGKSLLEE